MSEVDGARDFDFLMGTWHVANRRLRARLAGCIEWDEFDAESEAHSILGGSGNFDEYRTQYAGGFVGATLRLFDLASRVWSIYWADSRSGTLEPPVRGRFEGATGLFEGPDMHADQAILVRFTWTREPADAPQWEQAFSQDGGTTWETNWVMEFRRWGRWCSDNSSRPIPRDSPGFAASRR